MNTKIIKAYLSKVPAVLCTAGSYIAVKNAVAAKKLSWLSEGGRLFERMSPESVLKYEAHFSSCRAFGAFCFTVNSAEGPLFAVADFDSIFDRRFAMVSFFKSREEMEAELSIEREEPTAEDKAAFATAFLGISDDCFEPVDKRGLIDLKKYTAHLVSKLEFLRLPLSFCENGEAEGAVCMPVDIQGVSYMQMITMLVLSLGNAGKGGNVSVKLCKYGDGAEVLCKAKVSCELLGIRSLSDLSQALPAAAPYLSLCSYIAGSCGCSLEVRSEGESLLSLALVIGERPFFDVDFKSRDQLLYFEEEFEFLLEYITRLSSYDAKQKSEDKDGFDSCRVVL